MQCIAERPDGVQCRNAAVDFYRTVYPLPAAFGAKFFYVLTPLCKDHCPDGAIGPALKDDR